MTREEAIECLEYQNLIHYGGQSEALKMAISALSTEGEYIKKPELLQHVTTEELSDYKDCDVIHAEEIDKLTTYSFPNSAENKGDLISRQAVHDELEKWDWQDLYLPIHFKQILDDIPSADVRPNIHGHWEKPKGEIKPFGDDTVQCSECGFFTEKDSTYIYNFCPVCGADMREPKGEKGTE